MEIYLCRSAAGPVSGSVVLPGSKSLTQRALIAAALADGTSLLSNVLWAEDSHLMIAALRALGVAIEMDESAKVVEVTGCRGHLPVSDAELFCGNAGTVMRFGTAFCALGHGRFTLDGVTRMRQRPIRALADALRGLGCGVEYLKEEGFPPLTIHAQGLRGGTVLFSEIESSQFISALLLAAPYAGSDVFIEAAEDTPSLPYLKMTTTVMEQFGVTVLTDVHLEPLTGEAHNRPLSDTQRTENPRKLKIEARHMGRRFIVAAPQRYQAGTVRVEPDASSASYFLAGAALAGGSLSVPGLGTGSVQGDAGFADVLEKMGCRVARTATDVTISVPDGGARLRGVDVDLNDMPDMVPTLAVLAVFADEPTQIRNVANLRVKESDRLTGLARELTKLGASVLEHADGLDIHPAQVLRSATIETYGDHRLAMSFAVAGLKCPGLTIKDPTCCEKSFPRFFEVFERTFGCSGIDDPR